MTSTVYKKSIFPAFIMLVFIGFSANFSVAAAETEVNFIEGRDYITKFPKEIPKKPVVVEFFSYMCPHCYSKEAQVARWEKQKPESVELLKIPVSFGRGDYKLAAKSYYIAEELKLLEQFSKIIFKRIHLERKPPRQEKDIEQLFASLGVSKADYTKTAKSFSVNSKLRKADFLTKKYQVAAIPYFLVNFKYEITDSSMLNEDILFPLWNTLPGTDF